MDLRKDRSGYLFVLSEMCLRCSCVLVALSAQLVNPIYFRMDGILINLY
jgi:hypothetical protein